MVSAIFTLLRSNLPIQSRLLYRHLIDEEPSGIAYTIMP